MKINNIFKEFIIPNKLLTASSFALISVILSKFISLLSNSIVAYKFGTSKELDIFLSVQSFIDLLIAFFTITLNVVFIPIFLDARKKSEIEAKKFSDSIISGLIIISLLIIFLIIIFSSHIINILFILNKNNYVMAVYILRISSISLFFLILSSQISNILNSKKIFLFTSVLPLFIPLIQLITILLLSNIFGIYILSIAGIISSLFIFLLSWIILIRIDKKIVFGIDFNNKYLKKTIMIGFPIFISASAVQINTMIDRIYASSLEEGSIAVLNYARNIREIPLSLVSSVTFMILPFFTEKVILKKDIELSILIEKIIKLGSFILIPCTFFIYLMKDKIIEILFLRGSFTLLSKNMTSSALGYTLPGLMFFWIITVVVRFFYAKREFNTVIILGIASILFNIFSDWILIKLLSYNGIALSTSLMEIIFCLIYLYLIKRKLEKINIINIIIGLGKSIFASIIMYVVLETLLKIVLISYLSIFYSLVEILFMIIIGTFIYLYTSTIIKNDSNTLIIKRLKYIFNK